MATTADSTKPTFPPENDGRLWLWVVYDHPSDFPDYYIVRAQTYAEEVLPTFLSVVWPEAWGFETLEKARAFCAQYGRSMLKRMEDDDPKIIEVWV